MSGAEQSLRARWPSVDSLEALFRGHFPSVVCLLVEGAEAAPLALADLQRASPAGAEKGSRPWVVIPAAAGAAGKGRSSLHWLPPARPRSVSPVGGWVPSALQPPSEPRALLPPHWAGCSWLLVS